MTVKAEGLNPHSGSHWKRLSRRRPQEVGVPQLSCYTSFGLLNICITFSNAHLVFCYIFRFSNCFKHVKMLWMPQQGQFFLLRVWGLHNSSTASNHHFPLCQNLPSLSLVLTVKLVIRTSLGLHTSVVKACYNGLTAWFNDKKSGFQLCSPDGLERTAKPRR